MSSRCSCVRDLDDSALAHAVEQQVRLRIEQDGALQAVGPVVIVRQAAQAGLDTADEDRDLRKAAADEVAVDDRRIVRTFPITPPGVNASV